MNTPLLDTIALHARSRPQAVALSDGQLELHYDALLAEVRRLQAASDGQVIGLLADNSLAWILLDLVAQARGATCVPLPEFFSNTQLRHIIDSTGMDRIFTDQPLRMRSILGHRRIAEYRIAGKPMSLFGLHPHMRRVAADKLTFTSGTTARPKGVCLDNDGLFKVSRSLSRVLHAAPGERFLSLLPLATLLENISAHAALIAGATVHLPGAQQAGVGVTYLDIGLLCRTIEEVRPGLLVLVPQMLKALLGAVDNGWDAPDSLRFIAVGGATVAPSLLRRAHARGLPVYEGYGLSEAGSVVSLNLPGANRPGSAGRPLPHTRLRIAADGEILVAGGLFRGYLGEDIRPDDYWPTGDLGYLDEEGYLYLQGRKGNRIITSFGRNLSPEWPERELLAQKVIAQAIVLGDARPYNCALIVPTPGATHARVEAAVHAANTHLPEYARIKRWHLCGQAFTTTDGELSANGRPRRSVIIEHYQSQIEQLYQEQHYGIL